MLEALRRSLWVCPTSVGVIEEASSWQSCGCGLAAARYTPEKGMVLGAAVGFGFAALESAGYAFTALFGSSGLSLLNLVETEALRGILAPFGHGLWTAILGGALFATAAWSRHRRPRLHGALLGWYLLMVLLHALWDASSSIASWLTLLLTGTPTQWTLIGHGQAPAGPRHRYICTPPSTGVCCYWTPRSAWASDHPRGTAEPPFAHSPCREKPAAARAPGCRGRPVQCGDSCARH